MTERKDLIIGEKERIESEGIVTRIIFQGEKRKWRDCLYRIE
jgi:hypothetical protein